MNIYTLDKENVNKFFRNDKQAKRIKYVGATYGLFLMLLEQFRFLSWRFIF